MSGSYSDELGRFRRGEIDRLDIEYMEFDPPNIHSHTGTASWYSRQRSFRGIDEYIHTITGSVQKQEDDLWERMYVRPRPVIIVCAACKSHNAISNSNCVSCGAPMGWSKEIVNA